MSNPEMAAIVQNSFSQVEDNADAISCAFYRRLFRARASLRPMFPVDLTEQRSKLMRSLALIVNNLTQFERVKPQIEALGRRHLGYGVEDWHYELVAEALLGALAECLGADFTDEVRAAWTQVYVLVAEIMTAAAEAAERESEDTVPGMYLPGGDNAESRRQSELDNWMVTATRYRGTP